jgi:NADH dehydrogenase FAD-containing subunit
MFIPVQVEPDVGELASGYSLPYLVGRSPQVDFVRGLIEKIDIEDKKLKVADCDHWLPYHRIVAFSFGGIELYNTEYDEGKRWEEDKRIINKLLTGR